MTAIQLAEWDWPEHLRLLCTTPLSHAAGTLVLPTLVRGGTLVLTQSFGPEDFLELVARHQVTATLLVPTMIYRLLEHDLESADLSSLQAVFYGASPISPVQLGEALDRMGPIFFQFYGQSEAPTTVSVLRKRDHLGNNARRIASCGQPVPWLDVAVLDDDGRPVPTGERGEICVRGPLVMAGYLNRPDETAEAFRHGWLHTGDIATEDEDGFLTIVDRRKDIIISGGFNIFPREVEDALRTHPAVADSAVIGVPHPIWGEAVKAIVVPRPGMTITAPELIDLVKRRKGAAAAPKSVDFVTAIPLSPLGKPDKRLLRAHYWADRDRDVS
jgi:fatty-acyl-CoA synthase